MQKRNLIKLFFAIYILIVLKVIIFKYPYEELLARALGWCRGAVWQNKSSLIKL